MICLLLVCRQTVWRSYAPDVAVPLGFVRPGSAFAWRRATGERETRWRKSVPGVSRKSVLKECPKSVLQECLTRVSRECPTRVSQECPARVS